MTRCTLLALAIAFMPGWQTVKGQYLIELSGSAGGWQAFTPGYDTLRFELSPNVSLFKATSSLEEYIPSDAFLTVSSPNSLSEGYDNHPSGYSSSSSDFVSTSDVVSEANGTWHVAIVDGDEVYNYAVDIAFNLPFAELPYFTSTSLINGNRVGQFNWSLEGGSEIYPGSSDQLFFVSLSSVAGNEVTSALLPAGTETWLPPANMQGSEDYIGQINTYASVSDWSAIEVLDVRPGEGSPPLSVVFTYLNYTALLSAQLKPQTPYNLIGDYNDDGVVNLADYTVWRDNLGGPAGTLPNDSEGGPIGLEQYLNWKAGFGEVGEVISSAHQVPEPSNWHLVFAGMLVASVVARKCAKS